jgi:hypothetical protein
MSHLVASIFPLTQLCCWVDTWLAPFPLTQPEKFFPVVNGLAYFVSPPVTNRKRNFAFFSPVWVQVARLDTRLLLLADALALKKKFLQLLITTMRCISSWQNVVKVFTPVNYDRKMHYLLWLHLLRPRQNGINVFTTVNYDHKMHKLMGKCYISFYNCKLLP